MKSEIDKKKLFEYLTKNHLGANNGITKGELASDLGIDKRVLRRLTQAVNEDMGIDKIISVSEKCYVCETKDEAEEAIGATYKQAFTLLKKARRMEKKLGLNGQIKINDSGQGFDEWFRAIADGVEREKL